MAKDDFTAFLGSGTDYQGQLKFKGTVRVDCRFIGSITSDGKLILGKEALVEGTVSVKELVVHGTLNGDAIVAARTILHQDAKVTGTLTTPALVMEEGALLQGELNMIKSAAKGKALSDMQPLDAQTDSGVTLIDASIKQ